MMRRQTENGDSNYSSSKVSASVSAAVLRPDTAGAEAVTLFTAGLQWFVIPWVASLLEVVYKIHSPSQA